MLEVAKVVGLNSDAQASQVLVDVPQEGPAFFAIVSTTCDDAFTRSRQALLSAEEIFSQSSDDISYRLQQSLGVVKNELKDTQYLEALIAAASEGAFYLIHYRQSGIGENTQGLLTATAVRGGKPFDLLSLAPAGQLISGFLNPADRVILATYSLEQVLGEELIKLHTWPIEVIEDEITSRLPQAHVDPVAAIILTEALPPLLNLDKPGNQSRRSGELTFKFLKKVAVLFQSAIPHSGTGAVILGVSLLLIILIGIGVSFKHSRDSARNSRINSYLQAGSDSLNQAQTFKDINFEQSLKALEEARKNIGLALKEDPGNKKALDLNKTLEEALPDILKIHSVHDLTLWLDLSLIKQGYYADRLSLSVGSILILDGTQKSLIQIDTKKKAHQILAGGDKLGEARYAALNGELALIFSEDKGVIKFDSSNKESKQVVKKDETWGKIVDIYGFGGNIYLLDEAKGEIYKYLPTASGYSEARQYLKKDTKADFSNALRMQIESSVYILKKGGEILRFTQGAADHFALSGLDKSLSSPKSFFVSSDTDKLYLLDNGNKRLLVLDKKGVYISQYLSDKFTDVLDLVVDEKGKKVYLLDGTKIYQMDLK